MKERWNLPVMRGIELSFIFASSLWEVLMNKQDRLWLHNWLMEKSAFYSISLVTPKAFDFLREQIKTIKTYCAGGFMKNLSHWIDSFFFQSSHVSFSSCRMLDCILQTLLQKRLKEEWERAEFC